MNHSNQYLPADNWNGSAVEDFWFCRCMKGKGDCNRLNGNGGCGGGGGASGGGGGGGLTFCGHLKLKLKLKLNRKSSHFWDIFNPLLYF